MFHPPLILWCFGFMFFVYFISIFTIMVILKKKIVLSYKLILLILYWKTKWLIFTPHMSVENKIRCSDILNKIFNFGIIHFDFHTQWNENYNIHFFFQFLCWPFFTSSLSSSYEKLQIGSERKQKVSKRRLNTLMKCSLTNTKNHDIVLIILIKH